MTTQWKRWAVGAGLGTALMANMAVAQMGEVTVVEEAPLFGNFYSLQKTS